LAVASDPLLRTNKGNEPAPASRRVSVIPAELLSQILDQILGKVQMFVLVG
jgi:hypothetical protein